MKNLHNMYYMLFSLLVGVWQPTYVWAMHTGQESFAGTDKDKQKAKDLFGSVNTFVNKVSKQVEKKIEDWDELLDAIILSGTDEQVIDSVLGKEGVVTKIIPEQGQTIQTIRDVTVKAAQFEPEEFVKDLKESHSKFAEFVKGKPALTKVVKTFGKLIDKVEKGAHALADLTEKAEKGIEKLEKLTPKIDKVLGVIESACTMAAVLMKPLCTVPFLAPVAVPLATSLQIASTSVKIARKLLPEGIKGVKAACKIARVGLCAIQSAARSFSNGLTSFFGFTKSEQAERIVAEQIEKVGSETITIRNDRGEKVKTTTDAVLGTVERQKSASAKRIVQYGEKVVADTKKVLS